MVAAVFRAARHLQIDVLVAAAIGGDERFDDPAPAVAAVRVANPDRRQAASEPLGMRSKAEGPAAVDGNHLVDAVTEEETAIQRRDARIGERQLLAVQVADGQGRGHACPARRLVEPEPHGIGEPAEEAAFRRGGQRHQRYDRDDLSA